MDKKIVIVGLGSAGYAALVTIKRINPKAQVCVVDPKDRDIVHPCGLPYALEGIVDESNLQQDIFLHRMNVKKIKAYIHSIDTSKHQIIIQSENEQNRISFDTAIVCTGYKPLLPHITNIEQFINDGVYTLSSIADLQQIKKALPGKSRAIVVGAGAIGLEVAYALKVNGLAVTVIEAKDILPNVLDSDMAELVQEYCEGQSINLVLHSSVTSIEKDDDGFYVITPQKAYRADIVIVATGFVAQCDWALQSSLPTTKDGVIVNEHLEVYPGIYAAGDCIQSWSVIDKKPFASKLATSAYKQGIIAAENAMGIPSIYHGSAGTFVTKIGTLEVAATGFSTSIAEKRGFSVVSGKISATVKPEYFPQNERLTFKILCNSSGKIIGAQAIGSGAASRINLISLAIEHGIGIDELLRFEMAYCPSVSEVHDILFKACEFARRRMK